MRVSRVCPLHARPVGAGERLRRASRDYVNFDITGAERLNTKLKKALDIASIAALVLFVVFVVLLIGVRLFGIEPHIVTSGSMEPEIMTGSLVYVDTLTPEEAQQLKVGDTVTFLVDKNGTKVTHKIYEVVGPLYVKNQHGEYVLDDNGERTVAKDAAGYDIIMYTTYGVNNVNAGSPYGYTLDGTLGEGNLASSNVIGKATFSIPLLGYIAHFVQNPPGKYLAIAVCVLLIGSSVFGDSFKKDGEKEKGDEGEGSGPDPEKSSEPNDEAPVSTSEPEKSVDPEA